MSVPPVGKCSAAMEKTPGQRIPADKPHRAQKISDITGMGDMLTPTYDTTLTHPLKISAFFMFTACPNFEYPKRAMPIIKAKIVMPKRSPKAFGTPQALSTKKDAHWLIASSLAPALIIRKINNINAFAEKSSLTLIGVVSSVR